MKLVETALDITRKASPRQHRASLLICIAFYFLLRVEEYTKLKHNTKTVQFRLRDIAFWSKGFRIDAHNTTPEILISYDRATLRIENQKNGKKN